MRRASQRALKAHAAVLLLGTDCPALNASTLLEAMDSGGTTVIPALDGGYVALHLQRAEARMFHAVDWGSSRVLRQTRRNLRRLGCGHRETGPQPDLDWPDDWRRERRLGRLSALDCCRRC